MHLVFFQQCKMEFFMKKRRIWTAFVDFCPIQTQPKSSSFTTKKMDTALHHAYATTIKVSEPEPLPAFNVYIYLALNSFFAVLHFHFPFIFFTNFKYNLKRKLQLPFDFQVESYTFSSSLPRYSFSLWDLLSLFHFADRHTKS